MTGRVAATLAGAVAGFFGGLFGVGGGIVLVPLLTGPLKLTQHQAHGTSLAVIIFTAVAAGAVYALHGNVSWATGVVVGIAGALGAPLGARLALRLSGRGLGRAFAVLLLVVGLRMLWPPPVGEGHPLQGLLRIVADLGVGLAAGMLAGFMGVGGGLIAVPAFTLLLGFPQQLAQGTSLVVILGAAASGASEHARRGTVVRSLVPWLALGAVFAGPLASWGVQHLPHELLARAFGVFLIANSVHVWLRPARLQEREPA